MSPVSLPLWLLFIPVFTYGLLAISRRARLGQRLPPQPEWGMSTRFGQLTVWWVAGHLVYYGLHNVNERTGGAVEQTGMFTLFGSLACLFAANAEAFKRWVWMDLLANMLAEIGLLGYTAAVIALQMQGDESGWMQTALPVSIAVSWSGYHVAGLIRESAHSGSMAERPA